MVNPTLCALAMGGITALAAAAPPAADRAAPAQAMQAFVQANPGAAFAQREGRVTRVYGRAFSGGRSAAESAESFRAAHAGIFGARSEDLVAIGPGPDRSHVHPIGLDRATGTYRFNAYFYTQKRQGVPVFRSALKLLVRNMPGFPLVLASADLRDLGGFQVEAVAPTGPGTALRRAGELAIVAGKPEVLSTRRVIFAGVDGQQAAPVLADETIVGINEDKWLIVTDARSGAVLYEEHRIFDVDIAGSADGLATLGVGTDACEPEVATGMPHLQVTAGANSAFTAADGSFLIPNPGTGEITVSASLGVGAWFALSDVQGPVQSVSVQVTPPGPADLLFNAANNDEFIRAQVNGYLHSNIVRDFVLSYYPAYPLGPAGFPVVVNRTDGFCPGNAWYDSSANGGNGSINFCRTGGGSPNTAWSSVIYHEFGHHVVQVAGSGQGAYGEGHGDVLSVLVLDSPLVGLGFFGNCSQALRNADNSCQYDPVNCSSCGSASHACGNLISGCVWSTRNELVVTEPDDYRDILATLAIGAILMHTGSSITPDIPIDWLTLDDDDADLCNGTPHFAEIQAGFSAHGLFDEQLDIVFPQGLPLTVSPSGGTTVDVAASCLSAQAQPGSGVFHVDAGGGFTAVPMAEGPPGSYQATFPAAACGTGVLYYFSVETTGGASIFSPPGAPASTYTSIAATSLVPIFSDDFESNQGWTVTTTASDGPWERAVPIPLSTCDRGNPGDDADGSGFCFLTDNSAANGCNSDVDGGSTTLTSPIMDATGNTFISYSRWYSNTFGASPMQDVFNVQVSSNGGSTWVGLENVGPAGPEVSGGWFQRTFGVAEYVTPNNQFRIRFIASDTDPGSVVEAAVDAFELFSAECTVIDADLDDDGDVDVVDFLALLAAWGPCPPACPPSCPADLDGDCEVGITDFLALLGNWG